MAHGTNHSGAGTIASRTRRTSRRHPHGARVLAMDLLESRRLLAAFTYRTPIGNGTDDISLLFDAAEDRYEIRDTASGVLLASRERDEHPTEIVIVGASDRLVANVGTLLLDSETESTDTGIDEQRFAEPDTLRVAPSFLSTFPLPVFFAGGQGDGDTLVAAADTDLSLTSRRLTIGAIVVVTLEGVERAELSGGEGSNLLDASAFGVAGGSVTLHGAGGDDRLIGSAGNDALYGDADDDYLDGGPGDDVCFGDTGNDMLVATAGNDVLAGGDGDDTYWEEGQASYELFDSDGSDYYQLQGSTVTVSDLGSGNDTIDFSGKAAGVSITLDDDGGAAVGSAFAFHGAFESVVGTAFADTLTTRSVAVDQTLSGGDGDDTYREEGQASYELFDSDGSDHYQLQGSTVTVSDQGSGNDTIDFSGKAAGVSITLDDDGGTATGSAFAFHGAFESVVGTNDSDTFTVRGASSRSLDGLRGDDTFIGQGTGTTSIVDGSGDDVYRFLSGDVVINDTDGVNRLGFSDYVGSTSTGVTIVVTDTGASAMSSDGAVSVVQLGRVQTVVGSQFDDHVLVATSAGVATTVLALGGDDLLEAGAGDEWLDGGPGNDVMSGAMGNDTYIEVPGGADVIHDTGGVDTIDFSGAVSGVMFNLTHDAGEPQIVDAQGSTVTVGGTLENVIGTNLNDVITGNAEVNFISGLAGDDEIVGASGTDVFLGGEGADRIVGSAGEDVLVAGRTLYDANDAALRAIVAEWSSGAALETRVDRLRNGSVVLADGTPLVLIAGSSVFDDDDHDKLTGSSGPDWLFFDDTQDVVTDLNPESDVINNGPVPGGEALAPQESEPGLGACTQHRRASPSEESAGRAVSTNGTVSLRRYRTTRPGRERFYGRTD